MTPLVKTPIRKIRIGNSTPSIKKGLKTFTLCVVEQLIFLQSKDILCSYVQKISPLSFRAKMFAGL